MVRADALAGAGVCTENLIRIDCVTESPKRQRRWTHRSLTKDAPIHRAIQHVGRRVSAPILGGLHHHYWRI